MAGAVLRVDQPDAMILAVPQDAPSPCGCPQTILDWNAFPVRETCEHGGMWENECHLEAAVPVEDVWRRWTDLELWPKDDPETAAAGLSGPLAVGTTGWVKPKRGPKSKLTISRLEPVRRFDCETRFPGAVMHFEHEVMPTPTGSEFTHRIRFSGLLAGFWGPLVGRRIAAGFPTVMGNIIAASKSP